MVWREEEGEGGGVGKMGGPPRGRHHKNKGTRKEEFSKSNERNGEKNEWTLVLCSGRDTVVVVSHEGNEMRGVKVRTRNHHNEEYVRACWRWDGRLVAIPPRVFGGLIDEKKRFTCPVSAMETVG